MLELKMTLEIMRKPKEKIVLAYLKDYSFEDIYEHHINSFCIDKRKPSRMVLIPKYQYLIHIIITRCKWSDKGLCHLNAKFYRDKIFHDHYNDMLLNLSYMGIIHIGTYSIGHYSTAVSLMKWDFDYMTSYNQKIIGWSKKSPSYINKVEDTPFTRKYMESLSCLRLIEKDKALNLINETFSNKQSHRYQYRLTCINEFNHKDLRIFKIDEQNRIYHFLTSLPKELREFYNIKYELDIANSHPLLLNNFLIKHYNIPINVIREGIHIYHYDVEVIQKSLIYNNIDVPNDVIKYLMKTMQGTFYDDFIEDFGDIERSEVKHKLFANVFYSHVNETYVTKFRKAFIEKYPNVWSIIQSLKKDTDDKLPHMMMSVESQLFKSILQECWRRGYRVVNLHDALIVFDVDENKNVTIEELTSIIKDVYNRSMLFPTVKVEIG